MLTVGTATEITLPLHLISIVARKHFFQVCLHWVCRQRVCSDSHGFGWVSVQRTADKGEKLTRWPLWALVSHRTHVTKGRLCIVSWMDGSQVNTQLSFTPFWVFLQVVAKRTNRPGISTTDRGFPRARFRSRGGSFSSRARYYSGYTPPRGRGRAFRWADARHMAVEHVADHHNPDRARFTN